MTEAKGYFSSFDGAQIYYDAQLKDTPHRLFIVHGIGEHVGRYDELFYALRDLNLSVFICDLRGHGKSDGVRVDIETFDYFVRDLYYFRSFIEKKYGITNHLPFLMGHSLGGLIATCAVVQDQSAWKGLILSSPFFGVPFGHVVIKQFTRLINKFLPNKVWKNPIRPAFLTHDPDERLVYRTDPLIFRRITSRMAYEMFKTCDFVMSKACQISLPLAIFAAEKDRIVSLDLAKVFLSKVASENKYLRVFDGFYHELFHEKDRAQVFIELRNYLEKQTA